LPVPPTLLGEEAEEVSEAEVDTAMAEVESLRELLARDEKAPLEPAEFPSEEEPDRADSFPPPPTEKEAGAEVSGQKPEKKEGTVSWLEDEDKAGKESSDGAPPPSASLGS